MDKRRARNLFFVFLDSEDRDAGYSVSGRQFIAASLCKKKSKIIDASKEKEIGIPCMKSRGRGFPSRCR